MPIDTIPAQWVFGNQFEDPTGPAPYRVNTTGGNTGGDPSLLPLTVPTFETVTGAGVKSTDSDAYSVTLAFFGTGGTIDGEVAVDKQIVDLPANIPGGFVDSIDFTVPTSAGGYVLVGYSR